MLSNMSTTITPGAEPEVAEVESRDDGTFQFPAVERGNCRYRCKLVQPRFRPALEWYGWRSRTRILTMYASAWADHLQ